MKRPDPLLIARIGFALLKTLPRRADGHVVLVTSARPGEGKTFVTHQLSGELAQTTEGDVALISTAIGEKVDADELHTAANSGFAGLIAHGRLSDVAFQSKDSPRVYRVPAGTAPREDIFFRADGVARAFGALRHRFALNIVDAPPLVACGALLSQADAVVLVVDSRHTSPLSIQREIARAGIEPSRLSGVVLNRVAPGVPAWMGGD